MMLALTQKLSMHSIQNYSPENCGGKAASGNETIEVYDLINLSNIIGLVLNRKIIYYSSVVTSVCITSEYRTIIHSCALYNPKSNL